VWSFAGYVVIALIAVLPIASFGAPRWRIMREELPLGISRSASSFFMVLRVNVDVLAMGALLSPTAVGIYGVAKRFVTASFVIGGSFDRLIYNRLAIAGRGGPSQTLGLARKYVAYAIVIGVATSTLLFALAPALPWIFGKDFGESILLVKILCWILIPIGIQNVAFDALGAADRHRIRMISQGSATIAGATLIVVLTYLFGLWGTCIAVYATDLLVAAALWITLTSARDTSHEIEMAARPRP
jgi:O-antigen/teichoic acid export membrane protein